MTIFLPQKNFSASAYQTETIVYAKVNDNCALYKSITQDYVLDEIIFYVPNTYFVTILLNINNEISKVQYENYVGYVYSQNITAVSFTPSKPFLTGITFDILENVGTQIWSKPSDTTGRVLTTISAGTLEIEYIASTLGDIPIGGRSNLWYFARFTPSTNTTNVYEGYVYSEQTTNLLHIPNNLEQDIEEPDSPKETPIIIDSSIQIVLLCIVILPFVALFLILTIKMIKEAIKKKKEKQKILNEQMQCLPIKNSTFTKKTKSRPNNNDEIEIVFPEYDYVDDDDLL